MTPTDSLRHIDYSIAELEERIRALENQRRELINLHNLNKGSASTLADTNRTSRRTNPC